ncbi:MAG: DNA polymerase III subunit epsilon [Thiobacillaceae bacterium]|nr:DNA polymerase III subunit epsilon [Thiobacillaceae bacterium]MCX7673943.1 DNA polymerase III subunit epsilon [Thiobacillaceae bacterium]MDW8322829.1 DNA polymerase III subunit epsilon [Burkholderiales bacterium]
MRQITLDTETTGLDPAAGHRVIEIGAVEIVNRRITGEVFHVYLNPERDIDAGALEVHGLSREFLADKARFAEVCADFLRFIADAELIIHNAPFDVGFLDAELGRLDLGRLTDHCRGVQDSLRLARELHPGQKNNLDALCRRYGVDNSGRTYHGALLDAQLLAEVYLAMTRGQESLAIEQVAPQRAQLTRCTAPVRVLRASAQELAAHNAYLQAMAKECGEMPAW